MGVAEFTPRIVHVTASSFEEARRLTKLVLSAHLAACVNIVPKIESHYWWQGKLEQADEVLMLIKTSAEQFGALEKLIREQHSYVCPEIVAIDPKEITPAYRMWWEKESG